MDRQIYRLCECGGSGHSSQGRSGVVASTERTGPGSVPARLPLGKPSALPLSRSKTQGDGEPGVSPKYYPSALAIYDSTFPNYSLIQHLLRAYCVKCLCPALRCGFLSAGHRKPLTPIDPISFALQKKSVCRTKGETQGTSRRHKPEAVG